MRCAAFTALLVMLGACASDIAPFERAGGADSAAEELAGAQARDDLQQAGPAAPQTGLFGLLGGGARGASGGGTLSAGEIGPGELLPFGKSAKVCGLGRRTLGAAVDQAPSKGRRAYKMHDSVPGATGLRTHYLTGFKDGCARQVTGALVIFGAPATHETRRYARTNTTPYTTTDAAYETIKARICGVRRGARCPSDRIGRLEKNTAFVSVYSGFGGSGAYLELLLHDGRVVAQAMRSG